MVGLHGRIVVVKKGALVVLGPQVGSVTGRVVGVVTDGAEGGGGTGG